MIVFYFDHFIEVTELLVHFNQLEVDNAHGSDERDALKRVIVQSF